MAAASTALRKIQRHATLEGRPDLLADQQTEIKNPFHTDATPKRTLPDEPRALSREVKLLAHMGHEIKNPLNAVLGFAHLMASDTEHPMIERHRRQLAIIDEAARHILCIVNDMLQMARPGNGPTSTEDVEVPLGDLAEDVARWLGPSAAAADVRVILQPIRGTVLGNVQYIHQVLINLVSNAIKYNHRGGEVQIRIDPATSPGEMCLVVADTGRGISDDMMARLFRPFDRLGAEKEGVDGMGVGLCISQQLVERMGGRLEVSSRQGVGSVFSLRLRTA
jgi:signal transduction histidine kinase